MAGEWSKAFDTRTFQQYDRNNATAQRQIGSQAIGVLIPNNPWREAAKQAMLANVGRAMSDPMVVGAIKAYHGTPHTFPALEGKPFGAFDKSKIGSGEGAATYGHGSSYSAENRLVGKRYQEELVADKGLRKIPEDVHSALDFFDKLGFDYRQDALKALRQDGKAWMSKWDVDPTRSGIEAKHAKVLDDYLSKPIPNGHLLELSHEWPDAAREAADPLSKEHLLDWDKPLSEQPKIYEKLKQAGFGNLDSPGITGAFYAPHNDAAMQELVNAGIPGIKYLDGTSRTAGEGTHNFVMFEPEMTKITARDGVSVEDVLKKFEK